MSYRLFVRPEPSTNESDEPCFSWVLQDASGDAQASGESDSRQTIEQVLTQNSLEKVGLIGLVPAEDTVFCHASIPAKQNRFIAQALPYAVEEQVAQDVETLHLALGAHTDAGYQVAAIDKQRMNRWQAIFSGWQKAPLLAIYPDAALLPKPEQGWTFCLDGDRVLMLNASGEWLAINTDNLPLFAHTLAEPSAEDVAAQVPVRLYAGAEDQEHHAGALESFARSTDRLTLAVESLSVSVTGLLAHACFQQQCQPVDLCQGTYSVKNTGGPAWSPWKPLLAVAAVWFVVQVALEIGMGVYQQNQAEQLEKQAMVIYREAFPGDTRTHAGNVRRVIQGQLRVARDGAPQTGFLTLLQYTGDQYSRLPDTDSVTFNAINYSRNRGELVVDLTADSYDRMSQLRSGLTDAGLQAEIGSVVNEASGARGRLTVSGGQ
ncbi:MAG: type II secretion system protein GspL [Alteromonadaceae bacterium]|nr:type II secretion system protein GspL [Alteromonadaceae bacterium]